MSINVAKLTGIATAVMGLFPVAQELVVWIENQITGTGNGPIKAQVVTAAITTAAQSMVNASGGGQAETWTEIGDLAPTIGALVQSAYTFSNSLGLINQASSAASSPVTQAATQ